MYISTNHVKTGIDQWLIDALFNKDQVHISLFAPQNNQIPLTYESRTNIIKGESDKAKSVVNIGQGTPIPTSYNTKCSTKQDVKPYASPPSQYVEDSRVFRPINYVSLLMRAQ